MGRELSWGFVRNAEAGELLERFLVSAVSAVPPIRRYLATTGYPQIGGGGLHIAHLLRGGLPMLGAIGLTLAYLGRRARRLAALVGGVGFGAFIDELGKFITCDNDYFYRPVVALIYRIFALLSLVARAIDWRRAPTPRAALLNAVEAPAEELARGDLDSAEALRAWALLRQADPADARAAAGRGARAAPERRAPPPPGPLARRWRR